MKHAVIGCITLIVALWVFGSTFVIVSSVALATVVTN